jgi:hypothetical protein
VFLRIIVLGDVFTGLIEVYLVVPSIVALQLILKYYIGCMYSLVGLSLVVAAQAAYGVELLRVEAYVSWRGGS